MRSEIAKKILSETPQEVKDTVRAYGNEVVQARVNEILEIAKNLNEEEKQEAAWDYAQRKWNQQRNREYYEAKAAEKTGKAHW